MTKRPSCFSPEALAFLRALKRNNRREWFKPRKERYEALLRSPMLAFIERLADDFRGFAPDQWKAQHDREASAKELPQPQRIRSSAKVRIL